MNLRCMWVLTLVGTCSVAPCGFAAEPLRLEEAVARALLANPTIQAEVARLEAVRNRANREALPATYVVGADFENVAGTGGLSGVDSAETTLRIGRVLELGGKRDARAALGDAEINLQRGAEGVAKLDITNSTTQRFIQAAVAQEHVENAEERVRHANSTRREVARWVQAARNPDSDLRAAEITLADAELKHELALQALQGAKARLAASWGALTPDFDTVIADLDTLPPLADFGILAGRLPQTPQQRLAQLETESIAARRRIAVASGKPDVNVSLGVRRLEATGDQGLVMSFSLPLGSQRRASYSVAEADADLAAVHARAQVTGLEQRQQLFDRYQLMQQARSEVEALRARMLPKAQEAISLTRRGFEAGRFSFLALAQAEKTLFDLREREVEAAARYYTLLVEVERLTAQFPDASQ